MLFSESNPHYCTGRPCTLCKPSYPVTHYPANWWGHPANIVAAPAGCTNIVAAPVGCICPPTSEQTCKNEHCPRQASKS